MDYIDDLAEAWNEGGRDPDVPGIAGLLDGLETAVLELYISVLDYFTKDSEYDSVLEDVQANGDETQQGGGRTVQDGAGGDDDDDDDNDGWRLGPGEHWTSPRLSRSIGRLSALAFGQKLNISSWRHISTAIGRRYFRNASTAHTKLLCEVDSDHSGSESDDDDEDSRGFETNERRVRFRQISEEWHRLLGFPSALGGFGLALTPGRKRKTASMYDEALRALQLARWKLRRRIDIDGELVRLYGADARFRGAQ
ncbi:hypothetical protein BDP81DRAFT_401270 [Colletotrichum phormii]|uniref:Uncharacterized protein n=1 Tax=Colletotrichum phormii TaxID=359342 RepID=A0AAI9ZBV2_9PEZI|nr:uncharacterized protein BDP81DRAFT_401270 [Colletotrichum phormii]KAK1613478.1 hypothetical protein BDP81DRAFT_401270 [Colletotrichum phormii]